MSITAKELAEKLGISASAVSIALNGKKGISDEKRDFILRAAKEYGLKRPLRKSFSSTFINLVIFKKHGMVYGDTPFFAAVTEGISAEVANSGYNLQISYFYGNQDNAEQLKSLSMSDCAGIILLATEMEPEDIQQFLTIGKPIVVPILVTSTPMFISIILSSDTTVLQKQSLISILPTAVQLPISMLDPHRIAHTMI